MTNEIIENARLLADAIARSSELEELHSKEDAMAADASAQLLIAELQKAQERFMEAQQNGEEPSEADKKAVDEIEAKVEANEAIAAYMKAQDNFTQMLDSVNAILAGAIANSSDGCSCADNTCEPGGCNPGGCGSSGCGCS
ncbi:YlbF family regulator [Desulfosporosinus sp.]|uniref:YlbF family regulator n=1 Tax=Desulfosporosinus sp. TaxID=157907 RepID=UPI000E8275FA|nr:YlbF family regulator [Desulfosporosinus sp.]MBC2723433.1 YlbF family regulator [Desulfosporosinus sp.]MBC2725338.1 YlbF family regulator [Desulfosporosinus sp.]HBV85669.1 YlbF family regulator [Desulfosporosinus sp.]